MVCGVAWLDVVWCYVELYTYLTLTMYPAGDAFLFLSYICSSKVRLYGFLLLKCLGTGTRPILM